MIEIKVLTSAKNVWSLDVPCLVSLHYNAQDIACFLVLLLEVLQVSLDREESGN